MSNSWRNTKPRIRLDHFLKAHCPGISRRQLSDLCLKGAVRVNGVVSRPGILLRSGDEVVVDRLPESRIERPDLVNVQGGPEEFIRVVWEDEHLLVVRKPALMHSVVLRSSDPVTVADAIAAYAPSTMGASQRSGEAGLVQRLDYSTSGLMTAAKSATVWSELHRMMSRGGVRKRYHALVQGRVSGDFIDLEYRLFPAQGRARMLTRPVEDESRKGAGKITVVRMKELAGETGRVFTVVEVRGRSFQRHQVRAYLAAAGHPLVGDKCYGSNVELGDVAELRGYARDGFLLHACEIAFTHPVTGEAVEVYSPSAEVGAVLGEGGAR